MAVHDVPARSRARKSRPAKPPPYYPDSIQPPPVLPEATALRSCGMEFTREEFDVVRVAMAIWAASRQPKLLFSGYKPLAIALEIGERKALKASHGKNDSPLYRRALGPFLNATGLAFLNKNERVALRKMLPLWDEIVQWRETLSPDRRRKLNNPRETLEAFQEARKASVDPAEHKHARKPGYKHPHASLLEQTNALLEQVAMLEERIHAAEHQRDFFAALAVEVGQKAKLSEDEIAALRRKVRGEIASELDADTDEVD